MWSRHQPGQIDALRSVQGELEFLREKVEDTTLSDFTLDQIVEKPARRILDQRDALPRCHRAEAYLS